MSALSPELEVLEKCLRSPGLAGQGEEGEVEEKREERDMQENRRTIWGNRRIMLMTNCLFVVVNNSLFKPTPTLQ